jgi:hypothetical protein
MKISEKDFPVVKCFVEGKTVKFWCPFCKRWHFHGSCDGGEWSGHRGAHCSEHTPFTDKMITEYGYMNYTRLVLETACRGL